MKVKLKSIKSYDGNLALMVMYLEKNWNCEIRSNTEWCKDRNIITETFKCYLSVKIATGLNRKHFLLK